MTSPRLRNLLSFGFLGCATLSLVPLGCGATITNRAASEGPRVPDATAERLRECVDEFGGDLPRGYYTFDAAVKVDEEGGVIDVASKGVPHADLAACMRIALRGMTLPEELLRMEKLRLPGSPMPASGQAPAEREIVGHPAAIAVAVALAELAIQVGPTIVAIAAAVEITGEIAEVARKPKPNLNRCLDAAAAGGVMWENLCNAIPKAADRATCWEQATESEQSKRGWCNEKFAKMEMVMSKPKKTTSKTKRTRWIAERRLERRDAVGGIVVVRIGSPELPPGDEVWRCPFIILGLGDDSIQYGKSLDSMAALQNALIGIRCKLVQSGIPLRWELEGLDEDDTGFFVYVPRGFGLAFQQRMEKMIEAEIEERVRPIRERHERREARRKARAKPQPK